MTSNQEFILFKLMQQLNLTSRLSLFVQIRHSVSTSDNYSGSCPRPINQFGVYFTNILKRNLQIKVTECSDSSMYIRIHKPSLKFYVTQRSESSQEILVHKQFAWNIHQDNLVTKNSQQEKLVTHVRIPKVNINKR